MDRSSTLAALVALTVLTACGTTSVAEPDPTTVRLDRGAYFTAVQGGDILVPAGEYRVQSAPGEQLRLVSGSDGAEYALNAGTLRHGERLETAVALSVAADGDSIHLVLLDPAGRRVEAVGTYSGVQTRGSRTFLKSSQIRSSLLTASVARKTYSADDLPVRLTQAGNDTTGMPTTQYQWPADVKWNSFTGAYEVELYHYYQAQEQTILSTYLTITHSEGGEELFGSAVDLHEAGENWHTKGYLLTLERSPTSPFSNAVALGTAGGWTRTLTFVVFYYSKPSPGTSEHLILKVHTKDESGNLQVVENGNIKIYLKLK